VVFTPEDATSKVVFISFNHFFYNILKMAETISLSFKQNLPQSFQTLSLQEDNFESFNFSAGNQPLHFLLPFTYLMVGIVLKILKKIHFVSNIHRYLKCSSDVITEFHAALKSFLSPSNVNY